MFSLLTSTITYKKCIEGATKKLRYQQPESMKRKQCDEHENNQFPSKMIKTQSKIFAIQELSSHLDSIIKPTKIPQSVYYSKHDCPLDCFLIYECSCSTTGLNYWFYVTVGFSDMFIKHNSSETKNGFGFELTFRLKKNNELHPPDQPLFLMNHLARYVFLSKNVFSHGDFVPLSKNSLASISETSKKIDLAHVLISRDIQLTKCSTVLGSVKFLQIVPVTDEELNYANQSFTISFLDLLRKLPPSITSDTEVDDSEMKNPLLICDLYRKSIISCSSSIKAKIDRGLQTYGSGTARLLCQRVEWQRDDNGTYILTFPKREEFDKIRQLLLYRIPYRRDFAVPAADEHKQGVTFLPCCEAFDYVGTEKNWTQEELDKQVSFVTHNNNQLIITMSNAFCERFCRHEYHEHKEEDLDNETTAQYLYSWNDCSKLVVRLY
jgi:hypothetical protein